MKLKAFNLKVMHGILSCNSNLKKWKLKESDRRLDIQGRVWGGGEGGGSADPGPTPKFYIF